MKTHPQNGENSKNQQIQNSNASSEPNDSVDYPRIIKRFVDDFINSADERCLDDLVLDSYVYRSPGEEVVGREGLIVMFRTYRQAFPDMAIEVHDLIVGDGKTVLDFSLSGTHEGDFMGLPATGRKFKTRGIVISRFQEGKIAEEWEILDVMSMLDQLSDS